MSKKVKYTPMIEQYLTIKEDYADALVFFRLGDFYELFFDDAIIASKVLEISLTKRSAGEDIPMCGVPHHAVNPYLEKLINKGFKVAIVEQTSPPGQGLVEREVVKVISPGQVIDEGILNERKNNYIAAITLGEIGYMLAYIDISTGESYLVKGLEKKEVKDLVLSLEIKEVVLSSEYDLDLINFLKDNQIIINYYSNLDLLNNKLVNDLDLESKRLASLLINYLNEMQKTPLVHLMPFNIRFKDEVVRVDYLVKRHLEIFESNTFNPKTTLIYWLDKTSTAMGSRMLRYWLNHPIRNQVKLEERYDHIEAFSNLRLQEEIKEALRYIYDINRIVGRISTSNANPRDLYNLGKSLEQVPLVKEILKKFNSPILENLSNKLDTHDEIASLIARSIDDNPPLVIKEGGIIKEGFNKELDDIKFLQSHGEEWLEEFEAREREKTGIKNLRVGYNRVHGYYIEITKGNLSLVSDDYGYERRQTLVNSERFINPELKEMETKILNANERAVNLEYELFVQIRNEIKPYTSTLQTLCNNIALIDVYQSLSEVALQNDYVRPTISDDRKVEIIEGRHPVVEKMTTYVKNNIIMNKGEIFLITGPNMSGKSTYMRMFAVIVYLAQVGSFVPAKSAKLPLYNAIFTRIGSSDDISGGKSTFMVEMVESNEALRLADENSLILFDEIGRGTATYDGMALAQGIIEYIHEKIKAQTLFSTHYHELTQLEESLRRLSNLHVKAKEENDKMIFLYQIEKGKSDRSYGLQVAALAGLPPTLLKRSNQILKKLESKENQVEIDIFNYEDVLKEEEINVVDSYTQQVLDEIKYVDFNQMTPIEALIFLKNIQDKLKNR
ncbi:MAG TPA: DNA mismatch repair protein MutS [Acholeplasmataceae bacterium]|jgi:DNA mismatch repair protein MutS|nr:DNA mismatch repair protein MutS [Acholeplasmataceae bacterium]